MGRKIDLHMHSSASDGVLDPAQLMRYVHSDCGVDVAALTDHDTLLGNEAAQREAQKLGMVFFPGIELSCQWASVCIHIVGLNVDCQNTQLRAQAQLASGERERRAQRIGERFALLGHKGMFEAARNLAGNKDNISRLHFATVLLDRGVVSSQDQAFRRYLSLGGAAYEPADWPTVARAVELIGQAGGVAVLAHPGRYSLSGWKLDALVEDFVRAGGQGVELISGSQKPFLSSQCLSWIAQYGLRASCGSDFHSTQQERPLPGRQGELPAGIPSILELLPGPV